MNDILIIMLCIFLVLQVWKQPFLYKRVNRLETLCVFLLIAVIIFGNEGSWFSDESEDHSLALRIFLWICVALPLCVFFGECMRMCKHGMCTKNGSLSVGVVWKFSMRKPANSPMYSSANAYADQSDSEQEEKDISDENPG